MELKKLLLAFVAVMFMATTAFAGNTPEFDAVGCDSQNNFNDAIKESVNLNNADSDGVLINDFSDFLWIDDAEFAPACYGPPPLYEDDVCYGWGEKFYTRTPESADPCFPDYRSHVTTYWNTNSYEWYIVLQMKPESDIDLNIVDCVLKDDKLDIWEYAQQTGRYRAQNGRLFFVRSANPSVTVEAWPGPYSVVSFCSDKAFIMDARRTPTLAKIAMDGKLYTSKALWEESIVLVLPKSGDTNVAGAVTYDLHMGDMIKVKIDIPGNSTCFIRYGSDNVVLKYIGIVGTEYTTLQPLFTVHESLANNQ